MLQKNNFRIMKEHKEKFINFIKKNIAWIVSILSGISVIIGIYIQLNGAIKSKDDDITVKTTIIQQYKDSLGHLTTKITETSKQYDDLNKNHEKLKSDNNVLNYLLKNERFKNYNRIKDTIAKNSYIKIKDTLK